MIALVAGASGLLGACGSLDRARQLAVDAGDRNATEVNAELAYAGLELHWREEPAGAGGDGSGDSAGFREGFGRKFREEFDRRAPRALQGGRPVKVLVTVSEIYAPGALARGLAFRNPSVRIRAVVRDAVDGRNDLHEAGIKVVDRLPLDFSAGIRFRVGTIPDRLAHRAVHDLMGWLRSLPAGTDGR